MELKQSNQCWIGVERRNYQLRLARFIEDHGFRTLRLQSGAVRFEVPCTKDGLVASSLVCEVDNFSEARAALGY